MNDIWTSRHIETACKRDINFKWLLQGYKAPDHNTISRFRTGRLKSISDDLFNQLIGQLHDMEKLNLKMYLLMALK